MMSTTFLRLQVLKYIRARGTQVPLADVCSFLKDFDATSSWELVYCEPLIELCSHGYLNVIDTNNNDVTNSTIENAKKHYFDFDATGLFACLTDKFIDVLSFLGVSLSDTIIAHDEEYSLRISPIFDKPTKSIKSDVCVIMPFGGEFDDFYQLYLKKVCTNMSLTCSRVDEIYSPTAIMHDIWSLIQNSSIVIADCTGKNPNVMYELGIAHTLGKEVILLTQDIENIPFDLRHHRHIKYEYTAGAIPKFETTLTNMLKYILKIYND